MADFARLGHVNSGCCGDYAHSLRKSDHNPDESGYAHAQDVRERVNHDLQPFIDFIMANPAKYPQVKYLIYEGFIYYPHDGSKRAGKYVYNGPNAHAAHAHVSIFAGTHFYDGDWHVAEIYSGHPPAPEPSREEDEDMRPFVVNAGGPNWLVVSTGSSLVKLEVTSPEVLKPAPDGYGPVVPVNAADLEAIPAGRDL